MSNSIKNYLDTAEGAGKLVVHARELVKLSKLYQKSVPAPLAQASRLVNYLSGTIIIHAENNAVATKLRQLVGTLADHFSEKGVECNGVRIKVQPNDLPTKFIKPARVKPISMAAAAQLDAFQKSLPDSRLREALHYLLEHSARE